jgi:hypothetical protein
VEGSASETRKAHFASVPQVQDAINRLYAVFDEKYRPTAITRMPQSYLTDETIRALLTKDRRNLTYDDIEGYSYEVWCIEPVPLETKYFLPRIIELICCWEWDSDTRYPDMPMIDNIFHGVVELGWDSWPEDEKIAIRNLFQVAFNVATTEYADDDIRNIEKHQDVSIYQWLKGLAYLVSDFGQYLRLIENHRESIFNIWHWTKRKSSAGNFFSESEFQFGVWSKEKSLEVRDRAEQQVQDWLSQPNIQYQIKSFPDYNKEW